MIAAGIMSGTSLDGVDAALVEISGRRVRTLGFVSAPYPKKVRSALLGVSNRETHTREIARLNFLLPELYADAFAAACKKARVAARRVAVLGCHGQTIYHESGRCTLQIGDGSVLAERAGVPVVSDFRPRDIAAGGLGAPLVPYVDYLLFADRRKGRVALNIGGIANVTILKRGATPGQVVAFDTGPGNMVIDQLASHFSQGKKTFDRNGAWAARGLVDPMLLQSLLRDRYYTRKPPKSAGREQFGEAFVARFVESGMPAETMMATATALTAASVADGICQFARGTVDEVIVSGGGVHNETLMRFLRAELPGVDVVSSAVYGVDPDAKEAVAFAILAAETLRKRPSNLPAATGASHPAVLGKVSW